jgi:hypothetical protein
MKIIDTKLSMVENKYIKCIQQPKDEGNIPKCRITLGGELKHSFYFLLHNDFYTFFILKFLFLESNRKFI